MITKWDIVPSKPSPRRRRRKAGHYEGVEEEDKHIYKEQWERGRLQAGRSTCFTKTRVNTGPNKFRKKQERERTSFLDAGVVVVVVPDMTLWLRGR